MGLYWPRYLDHFSAAAPEPERVRGPGQQRGAVLSLLASPSQRIEDNTEASPGDHIMHQSALEFSVIGVFHVNKEYKQSC